MTSTVKPIRRPCEEQTISKEIEKLNAQLSLACQFVRCKSHKAAC